MPSPSGIENGHLAPVLEEIAQLRDLFQRRLLEDKAKNRLYEELYAQLAVMRDGLAGQVLAPVFRELLLVIDRVRRLNTDDDEVLSSITDELDELLSRREVRRVPTGTQFDATFHEAVRTECVDGVPAGAIVQVLRHGYFLGSQLLRPEQVVVAAGHDGSAGAASCA